MSYDIDCTDFERNMKDYEKRMQKKSAEILKSSAVKYAVKASQYVPPKKNGAWSKSIDSKLYKRPVLFLPKEIKKDARNRKEYADRLHKGYRFVVKGKLHGKSHKWYATTLRKAKKYVRIFNRGLWRFAFGSGFRSIGEMMPGVFAKLMQKSPNLANHVDLNKLQLRSENSNVSIKIANEAAEKFYEREANYQGEKVAKKYIRSEFKKINAESKVKV